MKKTVLFLIFSILTLSCSTSGSGSNSCNDIVCGGSAGYNGPGTYMIYRGTLNPDTCGTIELDVNQSTFQYYQSRWQQNPEGYCCWDGLK